MPDLTVIFRRKTDYYATLSVDSLLEERLLLGQIVNSGSLTFMPWHSLEMALAKILGIFVHSTYLFIYVDVQTFWELYLSFY